MDSDKTVLLGWFCVTYDWWRTGKNSMMTNQQRLPSSGPLELDEAFSRIYKVRILLSFPLDNRHDSKLLVMSVSVSQLNCLIQVLY